MRAVILATVTALAAATLAACDPQPQGGAPAFPPSAHYQLKDPRGRTLDLRDYRGKVVLLNFWATWCGPCRYEIPYLVELRKAYPQDKVAIIGVSLDRGDQAEVLPLLARFAEHTKINYPIIHDGEFELIREFFKGDMSTLGVPMTFLFDRQGKLQKTHVGVPQDAAGADPGTILAADVDAILGASSR